MEITAADAEAVEEIVALWERVGLTRPWNDPRLDFARAAAGPASEVLTGLSDGRVVATVMVGHDGHRGWVYYLAVEPEQQGRRLGTKMMTAAETWLQDRGVPKLEVMVRNQNRAVDGFYLSLGYALEDVDDDLDADACQCSSRAASARSWAESFPRRYAAFSARRRCAAASSSSLDVTASSRSARSLAA
jgi:ribosomal protein S18 acetylase RimI-like enzyme